MDLNRICAPVYEAVKSVGLVGIAKCLDEGGKPNDCAQVGIVASAAALQCLGTLMGKRGDKITNRDVMLYCALMVARCVESELTENNAEGLDVESGPAHFLAAMEDFEKLTGRKPDAFLNEKFVAMVRGVEAGTKVPLEQFLAHRPSAG